MVKFGEPEFHEAQPDRQRTPTYTQNRGIPVPEKDLIDPVAEYNLGELAAMEDIEHGGFSFARDVCDEMIDKYYEMRPSFVQGYADALEAIATREA